MHTSPIINDVKVITREISKLRNYNVRWNIQARLDEFLNVRGEYDVDVEFLGTKVISELEFHNPPPIVAIDGSNRNIDTPYAFTTIVTGSIVSERLGVLLDYPAAWFNYPVDTKEINIPYIGIAPDADNVILNLPPSATQYSPVGKIYDSNYNRHQVIDEIRVRVENTLLGLIPKIDAKTFIGLRHRVVIIDGPLYHIPRGLFDQAVEEYYIRAWRKLVQDRIRTLTKLDAKRIVAIGVVKRIEKSKILTKSQEFKYQVKNMIKVNISGENDLVIVDKLISEALANNIIHTPLKPFLIGPFKVKTSIGRVLGVKNAPLKIIGYVLIPYHPYSLLNHRVLRVEISETMYKIFDDVIFSWIAYDAINYSTTIPYSLHLAHSRCNKWCTMLFTYYTSYYSNAGIPLTYDTKLQFLQVRSEYELK